MSEEDASPSFKGPIRTYSRNKSSSSQAFDNAMGRSVKAAMSVTKWGKANYMPIRGLSDEATDAKRIKLEVKNEDPFSFETEDKSKQKPDKKQLPKQEATPVPLSGQSTKLPASRIQTKEGSNPILSYSEGDNVRSPPVIRTYSRTTPKKPIILDQFVEVGKISSSGDGKIITSSSESSVTPKAERVETKRESDDDDIFPVQFKRDPLKTYSGEVVTPVDKPDSPPPKKSTYKKKGGPRGRKPLTVTDPDLIEEYKKNWAAQQMKGTKDQSAQGLSNSIMVSKQEVANKEAGTTLVVVCKPKGEIERTDVQTKYFKNAKSARGLVVPVSSEIKDENGSDEIESSNSEARPTRSSTRLRGNSVGANAIESPSSTGSSQSNSTPSSKSDTKRSGLSSSQKSNRSSTSDNSQSEPSSGRSGKRYRIFKSRAPQQVEEEPEPEPEPESPSNNDVMDENPIPPSVSLTAANSETKQENVDEKPVLENIGDADHADVEEDIQPPFLTPEDSSQFSECVTEMETGGEDDTDTNSVKNAVITSTARESLAARLRKGKSEKDNDSDSTDIQDNISECSENFTSQDSFVNSQTPSEDSASNPVRRFFKSKKSSSSGSDLQRKIFGGSPTKVCNVVCVSM